MEQKKGILEYGTQVLVVYGFIMIVMNLLCLVVGEVAKPSSSLFSLGSSGIAASASFQLLGLSVLLTIYRKIFFTDGMIKKMSIAARAVGMMLATILTVIVFVALFGWFPIREWKCWLLFLLCFGVSFIISLAGTILKERNENREMEIALEKIKRE